MRIQDGDQGYLATLPLVKSETPVGDVLNEMKQFRHGATVLARKDGTYTVVTADEISTALGAKGPGGVKSARIGELFPDREGVQHADFGVMARVAHGLWETRGGQLDYRVVAIGHNAATVLGPTVDHWQKLKGK